MQPGTFYRDMIELSMDMVMLHLDTRLVFHVFRLNRGKAEMPFLDSRVVNFFANLPNSARAIHLQPKHVIRQQFKRRNLVRSEGQRISMHRGAAIKTKSLEELLLGGARGAHFRELLGGPTILGRVPGLFDLVDETYISHQIQSFRAARSGVDYKFIGRLAALESCSRMTAVKSPPLCARAPA